MSSIIRNITNRLLLSVLLALVILSGYFIYNTYQVHINTAEKNQLSKLQSIAKTLSLQVDGVKLKMLLDMFKEKDAIKKTSQNDYYKEQHEILERAVELNDLGTPIYTLTYDSASGHFFFGLTSADKPYFRHVYKSAPKELKENYDEGGRIPSFSDEHGTWLSAFHPIKDEKGNTVGVLMVDLPFDRFIMEARNDLYKNVGLALAIFILVGGGLIKAIRSILKEEEKVKNDLQRSHKMIEEKNRELQKLSLVASKTDNIILIISPDGTIEWVNDHYTRKTGYTLRELYEEKGSKIQESSNNPYIEEAIRIAIKEKRSVTYESKNVARDGSTFWTNTTLTPIFNDNKELQHLVIVDADISELKKAEEEITNKNEELEQKNEEITSSIDYAAKIQESILPSENSLRTLFKNIFVLFKPKDVVSGDFYWATDLEQNKKIIAVVDCTGHGVPGAMMSTIGHSLLNDLVFETGSRDPGEILTQMNGKIIELLRQNDVGSESSDGMDLSLTLIDEKEKKILYAGAYRPLLKISEGETEQYPGDRYPIGSTQYKLDREFTTQEVSYKEGDAIYMFTDGFPDQFGGPRNKKFSKKRLQRELEGIAPWNMEDQREKLEKSLVEWMGENEQVDDITLIGIRL